MKPIILAGALALMAQAAGAQDMMIHGGPIHTGVEDASAAEAVIVRDGRIAWVGNRADAPATTADMPVIDLRGASLYPGFTDGHGHLAGIGARELTLNLEGAASIAEAMARLSAWAISVSAPARMTGFMRASLSQQGSLQRRWRQAPNPPYSPHETLHHRI